MMVGDNPQWLKLLGGIMLVVGTSIGGGILALPIATAQGGFVYASVFLICSWLIMTAGSFILLELSLMLPEGVNIISMSRLTLGNKGVAIAWLSYLSLLYCLLSAYMSASGDVLQNLLKGIDLFWSQQFCSLLIALLMAAIVYRGIEIVDKTNRVILTIKLVAFIAIITYLTPKVQLPQLAGGSPWLLWSVITVPITAFGFSIIVPSMRTYFKGDIAKLRQVIWIGSLITLVCYILWEMAIFGVVRLEGQDGLLSIATADHATTRLMTIISQDRHRAFKVVCQVFTSLSVFTSFLGVSISLFHFFSDGLGKQQKGIQGMGLLFLTFAPPLLLVLFSPSLFIYGLSFAGISCAMLTVLLPVAMIWQARYSELALLGPYQVSGGKPLLMMIAMLATLVISLGLWFDVWVPFTK
jgi:tyrosine-specific transport protein